NKIVRYSTALFAIPESGFENLSANMDGWDYFGIEDVSIPGTTETGSRIVEYIHNGLASGGHSANVILEAQPNIYYKFSFSKPDIYDLEDKLLNISITGYSTKILDASGNPKVKQLVTTQVEAQNAMQVIDRGSATAIAFRNEDRPGTLKSVEAHVTMVMDKSGSMKEDLDGGPAASENQQRIYFLKEAGKSLVSKFANSRNIFVSLVPFSTSANNPSDFYNAYSDTDTLKAFFDSSSFYAEGGTNTGDGMRRAYHKLMNKDAVTSGATVANYMIILVDGVSTFASVDSYTGNYWNPSTYDLFETDGNIDDAEHSNGHGNTYFNQIIDYGYNTYTDRFGNTVTVDTNNRFAKEYVNVIGQKIKNKVTEANSKWTVYIVGYSNVSSEITCINSIKDACGAKAVYTATDYNGLLNVFDTIQNDIANDLWFLMGPDLK
ncbi:MAG: VWA domain-containing protein, partial [Clostridiales bacterium]|nr:VWA domain-containing protein [Clostridiales bacterium]